MKTKNKDKNKAMAQISISLPDDLLPAIDAMAQAVNRNRSNFIANAMKELAEKYTKEHEE